MFAFAIALNGFHYGNFAGTDLHVVSETFAYLNDADSAPSPKTLYFSRSKASMDLFKSCLSAILPLISDKRVVNPGGHVVLRSLAA